MAIDMAAVVAESACFNAFALLVALETRLVGGSGSVPSESCPAPAIDKSP